VDTPAKNNGKNEWCFEAGKNPVFYRRYEPKKFLLNSLLEISPEFRMMYLPEEYTTKRPIRTNSLTLPLSSLP
jgi:hypothetical protein